MQIINILANEREFQIWVKNLYGVEGEYIEYELCFWVLDFSESQGSHGLAI